MQLLTGRLLEAQEDERRRIARELHDDINQELAFCGRGDGPPRPAPPGAESRTVERVRELSAQVKELSSSVHDLSHQLHPSKLEQLGLVAAVRGLCKELSQHHGLDVKFTHHDVPGVIPEATALCLYRIVQEALRNVVKHSGTRHAPVELSGSPDGIRLRVGDDGIGFDSRPIVATAGSGWSACGSGCTWSAARSPSTPGRVPARGSTSASRCRRRPNRAAESTVLPPEAVIAAAGQNGEQSP